MGKISSKVSSQDLMADVDAIRVRILNIRRDLRGLERRPISQDEITQRVAVLVENEESTARKAFIPEGLSRQADREFVEDGAIRTAAQTSLIGTLAILGFAETIKAALIAEAVAATSGLGISAEDRISLRERLTQDLTDAERLEERIIRDAEARGQQIQRRPDANPAIFLATNL